MSKSNWTILLTVIVATMSISFVATYQMMISEIIYLNNENKRLEEDISFKDRDDLKPSDITLLFEYCQSIITERDE